MTPIIVPSGSNVQLHYIRPEAWLGITPPGCSLTALESLGRPGAAAGLLSHDAGVRWPDPQGCRLTSTLLAAGIPVALHFATYADALEAQDRLTQGVTH